MNIKLSKYYILLLFIFLTGYFPVYAMDASIAKADKEDVEMLLNAAAGMNSAYWASYIGETGGRVYIEYTTVVHAGSLLLSKNT